LDPFSAGLAHLALLEANRGPRATLGGTLDSDANICSMLAYSFVITEHDAERPWIVVGREHRTVTLEDGVVFSAWAHEQWPAPRWSVELDPGQLAPAWPG
jgi:hypothetical protein